MELSATLAKGLAICLFELFFMLVMGMLAVRCAVLGIRMKLGRRGKCRIFVSPVPIQAVPGSFSSRLQLGFFQLAKVVSVIALIHFETFGNSVEVTDTRSRAALRMGVASHKSKLGLNGRTEKPRSSRNCACAAAPFSRDRYLRTGRCCAELL